MGNQQKAPSIMFRLARYLLQGEEYPVYHTGIPAREDLCSEPIIVISRKHSPGRAEVFLLELARTFFTWGKVVLIFLLLLALSSRGAEETEVAELAAASPLSVALPISLFPLAGCYYRYVHTEARVENPVYPCGWFTAAMILELVLGGLLFCTLYPKFFLLDLRAISEGWFPFVIRSLAFSALSVAVHLISETASWDKEVPGDTDAKVIPFADRDTKE